LPFGRVSGRGSTAGVARKSPGRPKAARFASVAGRRALFAVESGGELLGDLYIVKDRGVSAAHPLGQLRALMDLKAEFLKELEAGGDRGVAHSCVDRGNTTLWHNSGRRSATTAPTSKASCAIT